MKPAGTTCVQRNNNSSVHSVAVTRSCDILVLTASSSPISPTEVKEVETISAFNLDVAMVQFSIKIHRLQSGMQVYIIGYVKEGSSNELLLCGNQIFSLRLTLSTAGPCSDSSRMCLGIPLHGLLVDAHSLLIAAGTRVQSI